MLLSLVHGRITADIEDGASFNEVEKENNENLKKGLETGLCKNQEESKEKKQKHTSNRIL